MPGDNLPLLTFADAASFETWLERHAESAPGAWLRFAKLGAALATIGKSDAVDCALAFGWVDGQLGSLDAHYFRTRFTPRRPTSAWSQANRERVARLQAAGRMRALGQAEVDRAKADGRWEKAYARQSEATADPDLEAALDSEPSARSLFESLDSANRYAVLYRVHQTKTTERRAAKIRELVTMLARGETIHPRRARAKPLSRDPPDR
jgi:uncharacterized protein YdeI (YjbR/CyaY-like superfamily)